MEYGRLVFHIEDLLQERGISKIRFAKHLIFRAPILTAIAAMSFSALTPPWSVSCAPIWTLASTRLSNTKNRKQQSCLNRSSAVLI